MTITIKTAKNNQCLSGNCFKGLDITDTNDNNYFCFYQSLFKYFVVGDSLTIFSLTLFGKNCIISVS